ncbi:hypothetical protein PAMP_018367 [Pampus punctatissimus]
MVASSQSSVGCRALPLGVLSTTFQLILILCGRLLDAQGQAVAYVRVNRVGGQDRRGQVPDQEEINLWGCSVSFFNESVEFKSSKIL